MVREISAGGVVVRRKAAGWMVAVIEPRREATSTTLGKKIPPEILALPKGLVDPGEKPVETALREVLEETGIVASLIKKLTDIKYVYVRSWGDKQRVFKIVSFYLLKYESGEIGNISPGMQIEVKRALWVPLEKAAGSLSYRGERAVVERAREYLKTGDLGPRD